MKRSGSSAAPGSFAIIITALYIVPLELRGEAIRHRVRPVIALSIPLSRPEGLPQRPGNLSEQRLPALGIERTPIDPLG
jgi:hypothetical protein